MANKRIELKAAAAKYSAALNAHRGNPKDKGALYAWDEATTEFSRAVGHNELEIIIDLLAELEQMASDAALLPVFEEAYREVMAILSQPVVISGSIARQDALNFRRLASLISESSPLKLYPGDDLQVLSIEFEKPTWSQFSDERLQEIERHRDNTLLGHIPAELARELRMTRKKLGNYDSLLRRADAAEKRVAELEYALDGLPSDAIAGGWTAKGLSDYAKSLETKLAKPAINDVIAERQRQVSEKGYTPESDDSYLPGILCLAGAAYAVAASAFPDARRRANRLWPWPNAPKYFDPARKSNPRVNLVKSAALIIAEIERLDRAAGGKS